MDALSGNWKNTTDVGSFQYECGYCGGVTAINIGYLQTNGNGRILICGGCNRPTFIDRDLDSQTPSPLKGNSVMHLPQDLLELYNQARGCTQIKAYTGCILICRKILMHVAVECGAQPNQQFIQYVHFLADNNYVPPKGKGWVDIIRQKGNEANHELVIVKQEDALELLSFVEMLLKFVYEFPARIMPASKP